MKIVVLAGGLSPERDVSLTSGTMICNTLREMGHAAVFVDIFMGVKGTKKDLEQMFEMDGSLVPKPEIKTKEPDIKKVRSMREDKSESELGPNVIELCKMADICYMGLHGGIGENGMLQATLDVNGIKYTGADSLSSALAMHKGVSKKLFQDKKVPCAKGFILNKHDEIKPLDYYGMKAPVVVKVCSGGSSIGVYISQTEEEYERDLKKCFEMEDEVLLEEYIKGREFAAPVIAGKAYPVIEIVPKNGWFDYEHKYQDDMTSEICPAEIDDKLRNEIQEASVKACEALGVKVYARPDFLLDENGNIYCVEVNTLPGMTPASLLPKSAKEAGIDYKRLCDLIIKESFRKYEKFNY